MSTISFWSFKNHVITRLSQIWMLSTRLRNLLNQDKREKKNELDDLLQKNLLQQPNLMKIASEEGIRTTLDYKKLREENPERAKRIREQANLRSYKVLLESDVSLLEGIYPDIVWSSLSIMSFSVFENNIEMICRYLKRFLNLDSDIDDMKGRSILERGKNYLQQVPKLNFDFSTSKLWERVRGHQSIRNLIAHNGSTLDNSNYSQKVVHFIKNNKTVLGINENRLVIQKDYIDEITDDLQNWLEDFFRVLEECYPEIENFELGA